MTVVVTGATGLLGRHLVESLEEKHEVVALVRQIPDVGGGIRWMQTDLSETSPEVPAGTKAVVHLAQSRRFREFPAGADDMFAINVQATAALLESARNARTSTFVFASSGAVYARTDHALREDEPLAAPSGYYASTKLAGELLALCYAAEMNVIVLRFFFLYGAGQDRSMLVPRLVDSIAAGRSVRLEGRDGLNLNPTHVSDAVRAVEAAMSLGSSCVINVAGPEVTSLRAMSRVIARRVGKEPVFETLPNGGAHLVADTTKMTALLGPARVSFEDGVGDAIDSR